MPDGAPATRARAVRTGAAALVVLAVGAVVGAGVGVVGPRLIGPEPSYTVSTRITFPVISQSDEPAEVQRALATQARVLRSDPILGRGSEGLPEDVSVRTEVPQSAYVISVITSGPSPDRAAQLANRVVSDYRALLEQQASEANAEALTDLREVSSDLETERSRRGRAEARALDSLVAQRATAIGRRDLPTLPLVVQQAMAQDAVPATSARGGAVTGFFCGGLSALGLLLIAVGRTRARSR